MKMVSALIERSVCIYHKIACVFLSPNNIIVALGYNGPPKGFPHCNEVGCNKDVYGGDCVGSHAELNAISYSVGSPQEILQGSTLYISEFPCNQCMKVLTNCGIEKIVFVKWYKRRGVKEGKVILESQDGALEVAKLAGITIEQYDPGSGKTKIIYREDKGDNNE